MSEDCGESGLSQRIREVRAQEDERDAQDNARAAVEVRDCLVWHGDVPQFNYDDGVILRLMRVIP